MTQFSQPHFANTSEECKGSGVNMAPYSVKEITGYFSTFSMNITIDYKGNICKYQPYFLEGIPDNSPIFNKHSLFLLPCKEISVYGVSDIYQKTFHLLQI